MSTAVFTIVSKNYFHFARTLMKSLENTHPDWERHVILVDKADDDFMSGAYPFNLLTIDKLDLPNFKNFVFRYNILELNTAVKPYVFDWLFKHEQYDKVIYLDPDIYVYDRMNEVISGLDEGNLMVLTPHLTEFLEDGWYPREVEMLRMGIFNLGFLAVGRHKDTKRFIDWWKRKLEFDCIDDTANGLFVDQKWMDMVQGYFQDIKILRHVGYNIAYWNAIHRKVEKIDEKYYVNGQPLIFFHYSGIDLSKNDILSRHTDRFMLKDLGSAVEELYLGYVSNVLNAGYDQYRIMKYAYAKFDDGTIITNEMRRMNRYNSICSQDPFKNSEIFISELRKKNFKASAKKTLLKVALGASPYVKNFFPVSLRNKIRNKLS